VRPPFPASVQLLNYSIPSQSAPKKLGHNLGT
jgi:hypothetical protein